jgi:predicted P-loop ATPase
VRRVRDPGCKFDEMLVIENEIQGTGKSTALLILAVNDDWFTDSMPLNATGQKTIETIRGKWIVEVAELRGYRAEIEQIKATLSRQRDRSRMAYGRLVEEVPRQCVFFGSTNQTKYLRDESGNRRIWPVKVKEFDLDALRRDRDQLWAEAAAREAAGASIRLDKSLWAAAAKEQDERLTNDPFLDSLQSALGEFKRAKISSDDVWKILDIKGNRTQDMTQRVSVAMKRLGWERPNDKRLVRIDGKLVIGFVRGKAPWSELEVRRSKDDGIYEWGGLTVRIKEERKPSKPLVSDEWYSTPGPWKPEANKRGKKMKKNTTRKAS